MRDPVEVVTKIGAPPATAFDLELDVDVHAASMARSREVADTRGGERQLGLGDVVTFRARHFGVTWTLTSRVTEHDRPRRFVDEQVSGPFRRMRHEHTFEAVGPDHCRMTDRMWVSLPLGPAGRLVARVVVRPYLRRLLRQRAAHVSELAERLHRRR